MGRLLGVQRVCCPLSNYWREAGPPLLTPMYMYKAVSATNFIMINAILCSYVKYNHYFGRIFSNLPLLCPY